MNSGFTHKTRFTLSLDIVRYKFKQLILHFIALFFPFVNIIVENFQPVFVFS